MPRTTSNLVFAELCICKNIVARIKVTKEYRSVRISNTPNAIQKAVYRSFSMGYGNLEVRAYLIKALRGADSPEIRSSTLEGSSKKKCNHSTGHAGRNIELGLWHDRGALEKEMDPFQKQKGQDVQ